MKTKRPLSNFNRRVDHRGDVSYLAGNVEITEEVGGRWMVLVNGFQWGKGPIDSSGCYSQTWDTASDAARAFLRIK